LWEFPGGKAEADESDALTAARELEEELGVRLINASPAIFEIADADSPYVIAFVPVAIEGEPMPIEHSAVIWDTAMEIARLPLAPSDEAFVRWLLNRG